MTTSDTVLLTRGVLILYAAAQLTFNGGIFVLGIGCPKLHQKGYLAGLYCWLPFSRYHSPYTQMYPVFIVIT